ncbi:Leucine rich repeat protein [Spraguea lophii 42_110]|uniref:Leucine rich repeat protein n=1 Tax=Spraguea lophii (strain 42_110) TaxID=1358809 RepID=S7XPT1_SPRLO|nr:Leucine rich repeat protein [Spraguea lophii 42_110]
MFFMNFLLVFFLILTNCIRYEITYTNYDSIKELIPNSNEIDLYDEITNNSDFSCLFEVNEDMKEIKIIKLYNVDRETGDNIFPTIFCKINDNKCLILIGLKLSRLPNQFVKLKELEFLDLSDNDFKEFPQTLFSLSKLRILYFNSNEFDTISPEIIKMSHLEILSIWDCFNLINISPNLFKLENLKELDLSRNPVLFKNNDFITCPDYLDNKTSTKKRK